MNRRNFLKFAGASAATIALVKSPAALALEYHRPILHESRPDQQYLRLIHRLEQHFAAVSSQRIDYDMMIGIAVRLELVSGESLRQGMRWIDGRELWMTKRREDHIVRQFLHWKNRMLKGLPAPVERPTKSDKHARNNPDRRHHCLLGCDCDEWSGSEQRLAA